jgi:hypothetical protein
VERAQFRPDRTGLTAVGVLFLGTVPLGLASAWFAPLFLLPLAATVWVLRARVVGDADGVVVCNGLGVRRVAWAEVDRFEVPKRGWIVLHPLSGRAARLSALTRRDLPKLLEAGS